MRQQQRRRSRGIDERVLNIIEKIKKLDRLAKYSQKEFAEKGGDADIIAEVCQRNLKPSQMRRFFDQSRRIQRDLTHKHKKWAEVAPQVSMLQPLLHYAKGRNVIPEDFLGIMITSLNKIDVGTNDEEKRENFDKFIEFFQAIVAYHKFHNPRG